MLFSLTSSCAASFAAFKDKVLEACDLASRKNVQFKYLYNDIRVQLCESTWVAFLHFVKSRTDYTVSLELETSLSRKVGVPIQPKASRRIPSPKRSSKKFPSGWGLVFCRFFLVTTLNEAYLK